MCDLGEAALRVTVGDVMTPGKLGISATAPLAHAVVAMAQAKVTALPVLGPDGTVIGCISALDAMRLFSRRWGYEVAEDDDAATPVSVPSGA
jgi:CBS domain-containing protein